MTPVALTVAGSDPSGGAGLQADLKTFHSHDVYGASVVTLITVQNTVHVARVELLSPELVLEQLDAVLGDLDVRALKTGALGSAAIIDVVAARLEGHPAARVVDPVMISKHGAPLLDEAGARALAERLLPLATLVTPNADEARALTGIDVVDVRSAERAARALVARGARAALVKGGHVAGDRVADVLVVDGVAHVFEGPRIVTRAGHGTGCTLAAAITARLVRGEVLVSAVSAACTWLREALARAPDVGHGVNPVEHRVRPD